MGWGEWRRAFASALDVEGLPRQAFAARTCGVTSSVRACGACGEDLAAVAVRVTCDLRPCPMCARRHAQEIREVLLDAVPRVENYARARAVEAAAELAAAVDAASSAVEFWRARDGERPRRLEAAAAAREALAAMQLAAVRGVATWRWKLITIAPPWRPDDPAECTVEGLARRYADAWARWGELWKALSCAGTAGAFARAEISDRGHVHIHALVFAPWFRQAWLAERAGCVVDVRVVRPSRDGTLGDAVREVAKYAAKSSGPRDVRWLAGARREVMHPELAAALVVARWDCRDARHYGTLRDAVRASEAAGETEAREADAAQRRDHCPCCGAVALTWAPERWTHEIAWQLRGEWKLRPKPPHGAVIYGPRVELVPSGI